MNDWLIDWGKTAMLRSFENVYRGQGFARWVVIAQMCCYPTRSFTCYEEDKEFFESIGAIVKHCLDDGASWYTVQAPERDFLKEEEAKAEFLRKAYEVRKLLRNTPIGVVEKELNKMNKTVPISNTKELLACPFCGGEAEYGVEKADRYHYVFCNDCGARSGKYDMMQWADCKEKAKRDWNKRTTAVSFTNCVLKVEEPKKEIKCPHCDSPNVVMINSDDDMCMVCGKSFPGSSR